MRRKLLFISEKSGRFIGILIDIDMTTVEELYKHFGVLADAKDKAGEVRNNSNIDSMVYSLFFFFCKFLLFNRTQEHHRKGSWGKRPI